MGYSQLFNLLCEKADDVYGGRLTVHVRCLIDETANIGQIPNLKKLVATIRSRKISACLFLQAKAQLKAIYKDNADTSKDKTKSGEGCRDLKTFLHTPYLLLILSRIHDRILLKQSAKTKALLEVCI